MPGIYKLKRCPTCDKEHRKKGLFCSQSCSNTNRPVSDETKSKLKKATREYQNTPEGLATARMNSERRAAMNRGLEYEGVTVDDFAVDIPTIRSLDDYDGLLDGYDKASDW
jgi:hypothetical protein